MSKNFCFTSFRESEPTNNDLFSHLLYKREKCSTTGKKHWQGCVQFCQPTRRTLKGIAKLLNADHVERCKGTYQQNIDYVKKEETKIGEPKEFGTPTLQGQRTDLANIGEYKNLRDVPAELIIKYGRGIMQYRILHAQRRTWQTEVWCIWGPPGTGKSRIMPKDAYWKSPTKWWDGYDAEEEVVLDDWRDNIFSREEMLRLCDRYPMILETKGGTISFVAKYIYITSNTDPRTWYNGDPAWLRRITFCTETNKN